MLIFFTSNFILTLVAILYNRYSQANVSSKRIISLFVALCWIFPLTLLRELLPQDAVINVTWLTAQIPLDTSETLVTKVNTNPETLQTNWSDYISMYQLFLWLISIGLLIFSFRVIKQLRWFHLVTNQMEHSPYTTHKGLPVHTSSHIKNAILMGYRRPKIIINSQLINSRYVDIILEHESIHFKHNDNYWLMVIQFIRSIYWWNPILIFLLNNIEELLEARCDLKSSQSFTEGIYLKKLTDLILEDLKPTLPPVANTGFVSAVISKNSNIKRLKTLQEKQIMSTFSKLAVSFLFISSVVLVCVPFSLADKKNTNNPIFASTSDALSISFRIIPLQVAAGLISEFYGIDHTVDESLQGLPVSIFAHQVAPQDSMRVFSHITNTEWVIENDHLFVRPLTTKARLYSPQSDGKDISLSLVWSNGGNDSSTAWPYDIEKQHLVDLYMGSYLVKAKTTLISDDNTVVQFEIFVLNNGEYYLDSSPQIVAQLGEPSSIRKDGEHLLTVIPNKL